MKVSKYFKSLKEAVANVAGRIVEFAKDPEKDFSRTQKISPRDTIDLVMQLGSRSASIEGYDFFVGRDTGIPSNTAILKRREQVLPEAFEQIYQSFTNSIQTEKCLLTGLYSYSVDGSSVRFRTDERYEGTYHEKCNQHEENGYNDFHLHCIMDSTTGVAVTAMAEEGARYNEQHAFHSMLDGMEQQYGRGRMHKSLFIADRGYESYADIIECQRHGSFFLFKGKATNGIMGAVDREMDVDVHYHLYHSRARKAMEDPLYHRVDRRSYGFPMNQDGYCDVKFRAVSFLSAGKWTVLLTNLPRDRFPAHVLKEIYKMRWDIETGFRKIKYPCGLLSLHSGKPQLVLQEIWASLAKYNLAAITVFLASRGITENHRINFAKVVAIVNDHWKGRTRAHVFWECVLSTVYSKRKKEQENYKRTSRRKKYQCFNYRPS